MVTIIQMMNIMIEKEDDDNNNEGAFLEQDHIWEQSQAGEVQHG